MGKAKKASPGRKASPAARFPGTKVAAAAAATLSKRQSKKSQRRKVAAADRHGALCARLAETRAADAAARAPVNRFVADGLFDALDAIAESSPAAPAAAKNATNGRTNRGKRLLVAAESAQLGAVLAHPAFAANPLGAVFAHLDSTLPAGPAAPKPAKGKKKRKKLGQP